MKAAVCERYGAASEVIEVTEVERPVPEDDEVLIKVCAAALNPLDAGTLKGRPYLVRLLTGLTKPKMSRPGVDVAGRVEATGGSVREFRVGDEVFGLCLDDPQASGMAVWNHRQGAFAEYVCAPESAVARKPENITFEQAAAVPVAALTALQGLRDQGKVDAGQRVLVNGAAGGVGTFAVQIAKEFGAKVTGVCSTRNVEMVHSIGADQVIDYTKEDFTADGNRQRYDILFDCVGNHSLAACRKVLKPNGILIMAGQLGAHGLMSMLARLLEALVSRPFVSQKMVSFLARPMKEDLNLLQDLMKAGKVKPVVDKSYGLGEVSEAIEYLEGKHARGKVVLRLGT